MKKFIYTAILLVVFQFAQAQEVTNIGIATNSGSLRPLEGVTFEAISPPGGTIQIALEITNTGNSDLLVNDTIVCVLLLNDHVIIQGNFVLAFDFPKNGVMTSGMLTVPIITDNLLSGTNANRFCVQIPSVTVGGVRKVVNSEYCAKFTTSVVGIEDVGSLKEINVFPNPVRDNSLKFANIDESTDIFLYNIAGQLIESIPAAIGNIDMDVSHLSNGVYVIKLQSGKHTCTKKIQVIR